MGGMNLYICTHTSRFIKSFAMRSLAPRCRVCTRCAHLCHGGTYSCTASFYMGMCIVHASAGRQRDRERKETEGEGGTTTDVQCRGIFGMRLRMHETCACADVSRYHSEARTRRSGPSGNSALASARGIGPDFAEIGQHCSNAAQIGRAEANLTESGSMVGVRQLTWLMIRAGTC